MKKYISICVVFYILSHIHTTWCQKSPELEIILDTNNSFVLKHPTLWYAALVCLNTVEFLIINKKLDIFGISSPDGNPGLSAYFMHNIANAFPTLFKTGPVIDGTESRSLALIASFCIQNYYLLQWMHNQKTTNQERIIDARNSALLTCSGGLLAWLLSLLYGASMHAQ